MCSSRCGGRQHDLGVLCHSPALLHPGQPAAAAAPPPTHLVALCSCALYLFTGVSLYLPPRTAPQDEVYLNGAIVLPHKDIKDSILEPGGRGLCQGCWRCQLGCRMLAPAVYCCTHARCGPQYAYDAWLLQEPSSCDAPRKLRTAGTAT